MGRFDRTEICELVRLYIQSKQEKILPKLALLRNLNIHQTDQVKKNIITVFKDIGFSL